MTSPSQPLELRYRRLLRVFPKEYRAQRGEEIVNTYMDSASSTQSRPTIGDIGDVASAGLRKRLHYVTTGLTGGLRITAVAAMIISVAMAAAFTAWTETTQLPKLLMNATFGPFQSPAVITWALWLAAALAATFLPGRVTRYALLVPLAATIATIPLGALTDFAMPPMYLLVPQLILGALTLAWPSNPTRSVRFAPLAGAVVVAAGILVSPLHQYATAYRDDSYEVMRYAVIALVAAGVLAAVIDYAANRLTRGLWALAILLIPAVMFGSVFPTLSHLSNLSTTPAFVHTDAMGVAIRAILGIVAVVAMALLAVTYRRKQSR